MKLKIYLIAAIGAFALQSCQQNAKAAPEADADAAYEIEDTTTVSMDSTDVNADADANADAATTTTDTDKSGKLADTISVKTVRPKYDTSGKYALANTKWRLTELNGRAVKNKSGKDYTLTLNSRTGKIAAFAGCNNIMGSYLMKENNVLNFLYLGATKMACDDMGVEEKFMRILERTDSYMIEGNMLHLHKGSGKAIAKFEAMP